MKNLNSNNYSKLNFKLKDISKSIILNKSNSVNNVDINNDNNDINNQIIEDVITTPNNSPITNIDNNNDNDDTITVNVNQIYEKINIDFDNGSKIENKNEMLRSISFKKPSLRKYQSWK
jgi:hypothetical protein